MSSGRHKRKPSATVMAAPEPAGAAPSGTSVPGSAVMKESKKGSDGFKKGGQVSKGDCAPGTRMDKMPRKARGGAATMRGRSPMSAASSTSMASTRTSH